MLTPLRWRLRNETMRVAAARSVAGDLPAIDEAVNVGGAWWAEPGGLRRKVRELSGPLIAHSNGGGVGRGEEVMARGACPSKWKVPGRVGVLIMAYVRSAARRRSPSSGLMHDSFFFFFLEPLIHLWCFTLFSFCSHGDVWCKCNCSTRLKCRDYCSPG